MIIKDLNKVIIVSSALTGCVVFTMDYNDFVTSSNASSYLFDKVHDLLTDDQGALLKVGYKN